MKQNKRHGFLIVVSVIAVLLSEGLKSEGQFEPGNVKKIIKGQELTRGVWLWGSTFSDENTKTVVKKLAESKINEVFLLVKGLAGTRIDENILKDFVRKAHEKKIKVHFWYVVHGDGVYTTAHPDACIYHCPNPSVNVRPYSMNDNRVNLLYPGYKEYVLNNIEYFLKNFNCDGIHLDGIRYNHVLYSFDPYSLRKAASLGCDTARLTDLFKTESGYKTYAVESGFMELYKKGDPDILKWVGMRKEVIYDYISSIKEKIQQIRPGLKLTAAFMPEGATDPDYSDVYYGQNYALQSTLLDMISPMAYFKSFGQPTSWLKTITQGAKNLVAQGCKICTGIQAFDDVNSEQMSEQIQYSLAGGSCGFIVFRYGTILSNESWNVIKNLTAVNHK